MKNWTKVLITEDLTILEVMKVINDVASQIAIVVDTDRKLIGTITDGDIRRGLIKGLATSVIAGKIVNRTPVTASEKLTRLELIQLMHAKKITRVPIVDAQNRVIRLESIVDLESPAERSNDVILMVGGLGSRLGELTQETPKPMLKVGDRPILETIISNFQRQGFRNFFLSVNYKSTVIEDYFEDGKKFGISIQYLKEPTKLGTAGSLSLYPSANSKEPVIVMNGDLLTSVDFTSLLDFHLNNQFSATVAVRNYDYQVPYGVVRTDQHHLIAIEEKPVQSFFVSGGIYVFNPEVLKEIPKDGYLDMPNFIQSLIQKKQKIGAFPIHEYWLDIGKTDDFNKAHDEFSKVFK
jgi:dTDP-glucose pyrophosphorylase